MELTEDQVQFMANVLYRVRTDPAIKMQYGRMKRLEIKAALDRGENVSNYRTDWIYDVRSKMIDLLEEEAKRFNETYPHDRISGADLMDVVANLIDLLNRASVKYAKKDHSEGLS